jgi:hypothetical protein
MLELQISDRACGDSNKGVFFLFVVKHFSLGWYYQPRLKRVGASASVPPFSLGS